MAEKMRRKMMAVILALAMLISLMPAMTLTASATDGETDIIYVNEVATGSADGTSWDNAYTTLQAALAAAGDGYQIWVAKGTYYPTSANGIGEESDVDYDRYKHFQMKNGVKIYGGFAGDEAEDYDLSARDFTMNETILSGDIGTQGDNSDNSYHVFFHYELDLDSTAELNGFTISGGNADDDPAYDRGAGMYNDTSSPTLTNVIFSGNSANRYGGGMYNGNSNPVLANVIFTGNRVDATSYGSGGGMYNGNSSPVLTNVTFSGNSAGESGEGGGMNNYNCSPTLTDVEFSGNSTGENGIGGGMYNYNSSPTLTDVNFGGNSAGTGGGMHNDDSSPTLANVTFSGNTAGDGGGMFNYNSNPALTNVTFSGNTAGFAGGIYNNSSSPTLTNVTFSENSADGAAGGMFNMLNSSPVLNQVTFSRNSAGSRGGGMVNHNDSSSSTLTNVTFSGNTADIGGGMYNYGNSTMTNVTFIGNSAVQFGGGMLNETSSSELINATFSENSAGTEGGGMYNYDSMSTIVNSIFWGNSNGQIDGTSEAAITYSLIQDYTGNGAGNTDEDPMFIDSDDLRLRQGSPAIDSGTNEPFEGGGTAFGVTTDLDGNLRIVNNSVDMGAYEYQMYMITASAGGGGVISPSGAVNVTSGGSQTFTMTPDSGYRISSVTVDGVDQGAVTTFTFTNVTANHTIIAAFTSSGSGDSGGNHSGGRNKSEPPAQSGVDILVNGKAETAAATTTTREGDKTVTTVVVDDKKVGEGLEREGNNAIVTIPVNNGSDVVVGILNGQTVKNMETMEAVLEVKTEKVTYTLPASQINIDAVSEQLGKQVELKDITVSVKISEPAADAVQIVEDIADKNNYQLIVKPLEFEIICSSGNKAVEISKFNVYVERLIAIPEGVDPSKISTGVILNSDGTFSHVPTAITILNGKYYARINSLNNSIYSLIYSPKTFRDVENHWAREDMLDMASRLVISGVGNDLFEPERSITRAEFASVVVRALGLRQSEYSSDYFDVRKGEWYSECISTASYYGLVKGYEDGTFNPEGNITRQEAMEIIARAMGITNLGEGFEIDASHILAPFNDATDVSGWAMDSAAKCVKTGIVAGRNNCQIAPLDNIKRTEAAIMVRRLLISSNLINK